MFAYTTVKQLEKQTETLSDELRNKFNELVVYCSVWLKVANADLLNEEHKRILTEMTGCRFFRSSRRVSELARHRKTDR